MYCSLTHVFGNSSDCKLVHRPLWGIFIFHLHWNLVSLNLLLKKILLTTQSSMTFLNKSWYQKTVQIIHFLKWNYSDMITLYFICISVLQFQRKIKNKIKNEMKSKYRKRWEDVQNFHIKVLAIHQYFTINNRCPRQCDEHFKIASSYILGTTDALLETLIDGKSFNLKTSLLFKVL